jgi:FkbM family methyltransferase
MIGTLCQRLLWAMRTDAAFRQLGFRRGAFFFAYCGGRLRDRFSRRNIPAVRNFALQHRVSGRQCTVYLRMGPGGADWLILRSVWLQHDYFHPRITQCRTILDVGANIGMATLWFRGLNPEAAVACVEPDPRNLPLLRRNLSANAINATIFECAVDTCAGRARLGIETNHGCSSLENSKLYSHTQFVDVQTRRIPEILDDLRWPRVDLLKLDIEGMEAAVLADSRDWLDRVGLILFELHPNNSMADVTNRLDGAGWQTERIGFETDATYLAYRLNPALGFVE